MINEMLAQLTTDSTNDALKASAMRLVKENDSVGSNGRILHSAPKERENAAPIFQPDISMNSLLDDYAA